MLKVRWRKARFVKYFIQTDILTIFVSWFDDGWIIIVQTNFPPCIWWYYLTVESFRQFVHGWFKFLSHESYLSMVVLTFWLTICPFVNYLSMAVLTLVAITHSSPQAVNTVHWKKAKRIRGVLNNKNTELFEGFSQIGDPPPPPLLGDPRAKKI